MGPGMEYVLSHCSEKELIGAELGTAMGDNAMKWTKVKTFKRLVLVDNFSDSYGVTNKEEVKKKLAQYNFLELVEKDSCEAASLFPDAYFDFVYIDSSHWWPLSLKELHAWKNKLKKGGFFSGHDFGTKLVKLGIDYSLPENSNMECVVKMWDSVAMAVSSFAEQMKCKVIDMTLGGQYVIERTW